MMILSVAVGSSLGTMLRYLILNTWPVKSRYFTAVFVVNMLGAFALGSLTATGTTHVMHNFWATGVIAGLTTFSTMMTQSSQYKRIQQFYYLALQIIMGTVVFGIALFLTTIL